MPQDENDTVLHQDEHEALIEEVVGDVVEADLAGLSTQVAIADVAALTGGEAPTEAEFNALAVKFNLVLGVLRDASLIPTA